MYLRARWHSIDRKLPLLIATLLLVTVASFSWAAYRRLQSVLLQSAGERLQVVSRPVVHALSESAARRRALLARAATDTAVGHFLASGASRAAALLAMQQAAPDAKQNGGGIELRGAGGQRLLGYAPTDSAALRTSWSDALITGHTLRAGETRISPILASGDSLYLESITALGSSPRDGRLDSEPSAPPTGYLVARQPIVSRGAQAIRDLIGEGAVMLVGSPQGGVWTDLSGRVPPPPAGIQPGHAMVFQSSSRGDGVGAASVIPGTPWVLWVEQPRGSVLASMEDFARTRALLTLCFVLAGALLGWLLSRRLTRRLHALTDAAEAVASTVARTGEYNAAPRDEIERLTDAFARMSARVDESHQQLEQRVARRTRQLEEALRDLRAAQEQLVTKERLATLGQLASAVGHELRNPLGVMTNAIYVLETVQSDPPPMVADYLGILRGQIGISERIIGDLLDTARTRPAEVAPVNVGELLDAQLQRLGPLPRIDVRREYDPAMPPAMVDPSQIAQIVLNLLSNAAQAMGERGGTLTLIARCGSEGRVELHVRDSGSGIPPELMVRIFEPLFTTKARGLGLGLWVSRTLALANGADLRVTSEPGLGAAFVLDMPGAAVEAAVA